MSRGYIYIFIAITIVICLQSIKADDNDEFAEFDDLPANELNSDINTKHVDNIEPTTQPSIEKVKVDQVPAEGSNDESTSSPKEPLPADEKSKKKPDLKLVDAPVPKIYKWESYYIEIIFILAALFYSINLFIGSNKNKLLAQEWYEQSRELLKQQFTLVGGAPVFNDGAQKRDDDNEGFANIKKQRGLIKVTESIYTLWTSGRVGMDGMLVELNLLKRHDLFSLALSLFKVSKDTLTLRMLLSSDAYDNFVFCLAHKTHASKIARDTVDINIFCPKRKQMSQMGFDIERLFVMSELSDATSFILDQKTVSFLREYERSINYIHITDQYSTIRNEDIPPARKLANPKRMATFSFDLPKNSTARREFILFSLLLLDRLRRFKLARDSKQKSDKNRQKITEILQKTAFSQRQEAVQAKKEEQRRLEKERIYNEDDPEKQRRWEKKEAKRDLKKSKMRVKQLKVKSM